MMLEGAWLARNAIGFAGLPSPWGRIADICLLLIFVLGLALSWRGGRRGLAAGGLVAVLGTAVMVWLAGEATGIKGLRLYSPVAPIILVMVAAGLSLARPAYRYPALLLLLAAMTFSSAREQAQRTKYEDVPGALAFASSNGFAPSDPVLSCNMFTSATLAVTDAARPSFLQLREGVLRFDPALLFATGMPMTGLLKADAAKVDAALGGGHLVGRLEQIAPSGRIILLAAPCDPARRLEVLNSLAAHGFRKSAGATLSHLHRGKAVMQRGATIVILFQRTRATNAPPIRKQAGAGSNR